MDATELLSACRDAADEIRRMEARLDRLSMATPDDAQGDACRVLADLAGQLEARKQARTQQEMACARLIDEVIKNEREASVAFAYYVKRQTYREIAADMHISLSRVKDAKRLAVARLRCVPGQRIEELLEG